VPRKTGTNDSASRGDSQTYESACASHIQAQTTERQQIGWSTFAIEYFKWVPAYNKQYFDWF